MWWVLVCFQAVLSAPIHQGPETLGDPDAIWPTGFTRLTGVRELSDGRVLVTDPIEETVQILDPSWSESTAVGGTGKGPGEYTLATEAFALVGDTTAVLDPANGRLLLVGPSGEAGDVIDARGGHPCSEPGLIPYGSVEAADSQGFLYGQALPIHRPANQRAVVVDSAAIERWDPAKCGRDTVTYVPVPPREGAFVAGRSIVGGERPPPFSPVAQWAVAPDGRIAIVRPDPFRVVLVDRDGQSWEGPVIRHETVRVQEGHKQQWRAARAGLRLSQELQRGQDGPTWAYRQLPVREPNRWPDQLPPFLEDAVHFAPDGLLWIQVTTPADEPATFYVIDEIGRRVQEVRFPPGRHLVGLGSRFVYAVRKEEATGLQYLERYRYPRGNTTRK